MQIIQQRLKQRLHTVSSSVNAPSRTHGNTGAAMSLHCRAVLISIILQYDYEKINNYYDYYRNSCWTNNGQTILH